MAIQEVTTRKNYRRAITLLNKVIESEADLVTNRKETMDARFLVNRGDCYKALRKYNQSLADYHKALLVTDNKRDVKLRLSLVSTSFTIKTVDGNQSSSSFD